METILQKKLSIDKTKWTPVKFGEVVFEPKESSKDPVADGIKHVVGLEHIESENIHLRKSQTLEESTTFTKKFAIGDVLFGRRRAYLRKASQASFNGICSGDITVFRAKENLMPELLPFVVNNEKFFDYAIKHSAGGLSPRVKFKDLANYEFLLPPKDQQAQLAKLLWAMDEVIEKEKEIYNSLSLNKTCFINDLRKNSTDFTTLSELFDITWGDTNTTKKSYVDNGYTAFSATGPDGYLNKYDFDTYGIVLSAIGAECGKCFLAEGKWSAIKNTITLIPKEIDESYMKIIFEIINNKSYWPSNGGAQPFISQAAARKSKVPLLTCNQILSRYETLSALNNGLYDSKLNIIASQSLQKSLINQVF